MRRALIVFAACAATAAPVAGCGGGGHRVAHGAVCAHSVWRTTHDAAPTISRSRRLRPISQPTTAGEPCTADSQGQRSQGELSAAPTLADIGRRLWRLHALRRLPALLAPA